MYRRAIHLRPCDFRAGGPSAGSPRSPRSSEDLPLQYRTKPAANSGRILLLGLAISSLSTMAFSAAAVEVTIVSDAWKFVFVPG